MKSYSIRYGYCVLSGVLLATFAGAALGQSNAPVFTSIGSITPQQFLQFQQSRQELGQQFQLLLQQDATDQQLNDWLNQNQDVIHEQQALAAQLGAQAAAQPLPAVTPLVTPAGASQDLSDFLAARFTLATLRVSIHNQLLVQGIVSGTQEETTFDQQAAVVLQVQLQRAQRMALASDRQALPVPPPLEIPSNASPTLRTFLTLKYQLMSGEIAIRNQNLSMDAPTRQAALQGWQQSQASQFQQLQALAQTLAQESSD